MSYPSVKLGEVCEVLSGYAWTAAKFNTDKIGMPVIRIQNVASVMDCDFAYWDESYDERFVIRTGDIVLTLSGSFRVESWKGPDALLNQRIVKITPSSKLDERWFLNVLQTRLSEIESLGRHALVNNVSISDIKNLDIPAPPLSEQRRIATILDQADALRAKRREAVAQLDSLTQSIFNEIFGDPVANPLRWRKVSMADVVAGKYGIKAGPFGSSLKKEEYTSKGYRIYGQEQVIAGRFDIGDYYISEQKFKQLKSCAVAEGDLLVSLVGSFGKVLIVPSGIEPGIINPRLLKISPSQQFVTSKFLASLLQHPSVQSHFSQVAHGGTMGILNAGLLKQLEVILPPIELQEEFAQQLAATESLCQQHQESAKTFDSLFASLQHRAFRGEL